VWPHAAKHLHLFTASRGDERNIRCDRRADSYRAVSDPPDMAATPPHDVGFGPSWVAGVGTILIGLSPENVNVPLHILGALNIPAGNVVMILLGLAIWRDRPGMAKFSVVAGVVGLLGMLAGPFLVILTGHGGGLAERVALYPLIIWLIAFGLSPISVGAPQSWARAGVASPCHGSIGKSVGDVPLAAISAKV
jgi:hypothetical protein